MPKGILAQFLLPFLSLFQENVASIIWQMACIYPSPLGFFFSYTTENSLTHDTSIHYMQPRCPRFTETSTTYEEFPKFPTAQEKTIAIYSL
jgi:hypothetical protein